MGKYQFSVIQKYFIWLEYGRKCYLCKKPKDFQDITVDHIVPERLDGTEDLEYVRREFGLDESFVVNDYPNWAACCVTCNQDKGVKIFKGHRMSIYLDNAKKKAQLIQARVERSSHKNGKGKSLPQFPMNVFEGEYEESMDIEEQRNKLPKQPKIRNFAVFAETAPETMVTEESPTLGHDENKRRKKQPKTMQIKDFLNVADTALLLGMSRTTIYSYLKSGELECIRMGSRTLISRQRIYDKLPARDTACSDSASIRHNDFLNVTQAASLLGLSRTTIYGYLKAGELECMRLGSSYLISRQRIYDKLPARDTTRCFDSASIRHNDFLNVTEAASLLGVSRTTIYTYLKAGELECIRLGCKTLISRQMIYDKLSAGSTI